MSENMGRKMNHFLITVSFPNPSNLTYYEVTVAKTSEAFEIDNCLFMNCSSCNSTIYFDVAVKERNEPEILEITEIPPELPTKETHALELLPEVQPQVSNAEMLKSSLALEDIDSLQPLSTPIWLIYNENYDLDTPTPVPPPPEEQNRPFQCGLCSKFFKTKDALRSHIVFVHKSPEKFPCPHCQSKFQWKNLLQNHIARHHTHHRPRPFACSLCPSRFFDNFSLQSHNQSRHGELAFACPTCDARFARKSQLVSHQVSHSPNRRFVCSFNCGSSFPREASRRIHERIHRGDRCYPCTYPGCEMRFYDEGSLRQHKLNHVKRDNQLGSMPLPEVAKRFMDENKKFYWEY